MKNKRGQFYLLSSIIIVAIIISFAAISNYSYKKSPGKIDYLSEELKTEGEVVLDYEQVSGESVFDDFAMKYSQYAGSNSEIYFIVGNPDSGGIEAFRYDGDEQINFNGDLEVDETNETINFNMDSDMYSFKLQEGKNFYFVVVQEDGGEKYVATN